MQQQWAVGQTDDWSAYLTTVDGTPTPSVLGWVAPAYPLLTAYYDTGLYKDIPLVGAFHGGFLDPWVPKNMASGNSGMLPRTPLGIKTVMAWNPENTDPVNTGLHRRASTHYGPWKAEDAGPTGAVQAGMMLLKPHWRTARPTCPTSTLRDAFLAVDIVGPEGRVFFAPGDNVATKPMYIVEVAEQDPASHPDDPRLCSCTTY